MNLDLVTNFELLQFKYYMLNGKIFIFSEETQLTKKFSTWASR